MLIALASPPALKAGFLLPKYLFRISRLSKMTLEDPSHNIQILRKIDLTIPANDFIGQPTCEYSSVILVADEFALELDQIDIHNYQLIG